MGPRSQPLCATVGVALFAVALAGCRADRCRDAAPAFELELILPAGVDGAQVAELSVDVLVDGQRRSKTTLPVKGELADGQTSLAVGVRNVGPAGFAVEVHVEIRDSGGRVIARGQASFAGSGDACNFFRVSLAGADRGTDARAEAPCRSNADCVDALPCTEDTCTNLGCVHTPAVGCLVGGACFAAGALNPENPCENCNPFSSALSFTSFPGKGCVQTIAGSGSTSNGEHADGPARLARFDRPTGLVADSSGALFVADAQGSCVRKLSGGMVSTIAGVPHVEGLKDGAGSSALFYAPSGVALSGGLIVADEGNHTLRRIDLQTLVVSTLLGDGTPGFADGPASTAKVDEPGQLAPGPAGIYLADAFNNRIRLVASDGKGGWTVSTVAGSGAAGTKDGPAATAEFFSPRGLAVLDATSLLVADTGNHTIRLVRTEGGTTVATLAGGAGDYQDGPGAQARFAQPFGLAASGTSSSFVLYVADRANCRIRKVTAAAGSVMVSTLAGDGKPGLRDGLASQAQFREPEGIAIDSAGTIYVADTGNNRIRVINP